MSRRAALILSLLAGCAEAPIPLPVPKLKPGQPTPVVSHAWRAVTPPIHSEWPPLTPMPIREGHLSNGMTVYLIECPDAATVRASVLSRAGSALDPLDKPGVSQLTWATMLGGAGGLDEPELWKEFRRLGAVPATENERTGIQIGVTVEPANVRRAVELLATVVTKPDFRPATLDRMRNRFENELLLEEKRPNFIADGVLDPLLAGPQHWLARPVRGTHASLVAATVNDLRTFQRRWIAPDTTALVLAGRISEAEAGKIAEDVFGSWSGSAQRLPPSAPLRPVSVGPPALSPRKGVAQAFIAMGRLTARTGDPDLPAFDVVTTMLPRLFYEELRERLKLTYGLHVKTFADVELGLFLAYTTVRGDAIGRTLEATADCLRRLRRKFEEKSPRLQQYLALVKESVVQNMWLRYDGVDGAVLAAKLMFLQRLPLDWAVQYEQRLKAVTPDDINRVIDRYLDPKDLHVVIVADPGILSTLSLDWPPASLPFH